MLNSIKRFLILSSLFVLTACGMGNNEEPESDTSDDTTEEVTEKEEVEDVAEEEPEEDEAEDEKAEPEEVVEESAPEEVEEEPEPEPAPAPETSEFQWLYDELAGKSFIFSSGAGAWRTIIDLTDNGQFTGTYSDADGPNVDVSEFTGRFNINQEVDEYTYRMELENFHVTSRTGEQEPDGNMTITYVAEPHGFQSGSSTFELYLPFKPKSQVSNEYLSWVSGQAYNDRDFLNSFGLNNLTHGFGMEEYFSSY